MEVRKAQVDDIGLMIELLLLMQAESPVYRPFTVDYSKVYKVLLEFTLNPNLLAVLLDDGSGMLLGKVEESLWFKEATAWEEILFVRQESRDTSRGGKLMQAFEDWAKEKNITDVRAVLATEVTFEKTFDFYERLGYKPFGALFHKEG